MVWGSRTDKYAKEFQCVLCLYELVFHSAPGLETLISISRSWLQKWDTSSDIIITAYLNYNSGENAEIKKSLASSILGQIPLLFAKMTCSCVPHESILEKSDNDVQF